MVAVGEGKGFGVADGTPVATTDGAGVIVKEGG